MVDRGVSGRGRIAGLKRLDVHLLDRKGGAVLGDINAPSLGRDLMRRVLRSSTFLWPLAWSKWKSGAWTKPGYAQNGMLMTCF